VSVLLRDGSRGDLLGIAGLVVALAIVLIEMWFPVAWTVTYKGHTIRLYNHPISGERLYIDGKLADRGRFGFDITMRGTIEDGAGAGERITAHVTCAFHRLACRIVAETFVPTTTSRPAGS
jgi:hypothetical protein